MNKSIFKTGGPVDLPLLILALSAIVIWINLIVIKDTEPRMSTDSVEYLMMEFDSLESAMSSVRTVAYPVLLQAILSVTDDLSPLPGIQLGFFFLSVIVYFIAVRRYTESAWLALCAALPILNTRFPYLFFDQVLTDLIGCSMMLIAVALTLFYTRRNTPAILLALGLSVFMAYQMRPSYLFIVVAVPCIYLTLILLERHFHVNWARFGGVVAISTLPLVVFCLMRLLIVGQFNLVSFGGYNLIGIASSMLNPQIIQQLDEEDQTLARDIYRERLARGYQPIQEKFSGGFSAAAFAWGKEYNMNIWKIAIPKAVQRENPGRTLTRDEYNREKLNAPVLNMKISRLSSAVIVLEPVLYLKWVTYQVGSSLLHIAVDGYRQNFWFLIVLAGLVILRTSMKGVRWYYQRLIFAAAPIVIALFCLIGGLLLVALVETALTRYSEAVAIFVPGAVLAHIYSLCVE